MEMTGKMRWKGFSLCFLQRWGASGIVFLMLMQASVAFSQEWIYTVQPGDNLWNIGKRYLVSMRYWKKLQVLNTIRDPMHMTPGTTLRFPVDWLKKGATAGKLVKLAGAVTVVERRTGAVKKAWEGMFLWGGDTLRTGAEASASLRFADGSQVLVQENSSLTLEHLMGFGQTGMTETKVRLENGRSHNKVQPRKGPASRFEISTPSAIASVRGTEYRVSTDDNGESRAEVLRGLVRVDSSGAAREVPQGFGTITYPDREPHALVQLLPPPDLTNFSPVVTRIPFPITILPIDGAMLYRLQIAEGECFDALVFDSVFSSTNLWGPDLPDGAYYLRIHAIDDNGLEGFDTVEAFAVDAHPSPPLQIQPAQGEVVTEPPPVFQWSRPQGVMAYRFQLAADPQFARVLIDEANFRDTTLRPITGLTPGLYYWRVASIDGEGKRGPFSDGQKFRLPPPCPDMSGSTFDKNELTFHWRKGEAGQKYRCQIARDKDFIRLLADEEVSQPRYSLENFTSGRYYVRVAIVDTEGFLGPFGPYQTVDVPGPPPPPWAYAIPVLVVILISL